MMTDPIADMLNRIRNAQMRSHATVAVPASKMKRRIAEILVSEGYVAQVVDATLAGHDAIELTLRYIEGQPVIQSMQRSSRPGRRVYVPSDKIPQVRGGLGLAIVSTSRGVLAGREAKAQGVGGELLCTIY